MATRPEDRWAVGMAEHRRPTTSPQRNSARERVTRASATGVPRETTAAATKHRRNPYAGASIEMGRLSARSVPRYCSTSASRESSDEKL